MNSLSVEQKAAVEEKGKVILSACPGSGKTYTVAQRLSQMIQEWQYQHCGIAVLSFTNVAHEEISRQLEKMGNASISPYPHFLGTIDHFVNSWIFLPFGHKVMGCKNRPSIVGLNNNIWHPDSYEWAWREQECNKSCKLINFTYDITGKLINNDSKNKNNDCPLKMKRCSELKAKFCKEGYANQSDANYWAMRILEIYPLVAKSLAKRFPALIIDEAQDTSDIQMRIIEILVSNGLSEVLIVGDPDQAIYEWREANPKIFVDKTKDTNWTPKYLTENRRSSQHICNATKAFAFHLPKISTAVGDSAGFSELPKIIKYNSNSISSLKNQFVKLCEKFSIEISPQNIAILVRGNTTLRRVLGLDDKDINPWKEDNIAKLLAQAVLYRDTKDIKLAMKYLNSVVSKICFGSYNLSEAEIENQLHGCMSIDKWKIGLWGLLKQLPDSNEELGIWIKNTENILNEWFKINNWPALEECSFTSEIYGYKIINGKRESGYLKEPLKTFVTKASYCDDITVETIHAAKGKTYEAVMFIVTKQGKCTINQLATLPNDDEEIRIAYVAMTRPRKLLVVAVPDSTKPIQLKKFPEEYWHYI